MKKSKKPDWKQLKNEYETTEISYRRLAEKYRVPTNTLKSRMEREKWSKTTKKEQPNINPKTIEPNWLEIEQEYIFNDISLKKLSEKYKIPESTIEKRSTREFWRKKKIEIGEKYAENVREKTLEKKVEIAVEHNLNPDWVLNTLKEITERCMNRVPIMEKDEFGNMVHSGEWKFDSSGANKAVENIGKYFKMFTEKQDVTHKIQKIKINYLDELEDDGEGD
jgi:hypothetical protein